MVVEKVGKLSGRLINEVRLMSMGTSWKLEEKFEELKVSGFLPGHLDQSDWEPWLAEAFKGKKLTMQADES